MENAGSKIFYSSIKCRSCKPCKEHEQTELMSVKVEVEQNVIDKLVKVDLESRRTIASVPLLHNPAVKLAHNKNEARQIYNQKIKKLNQNPKDKKDVIESEAKLQALGYVDFLKNLSSEQQQILKQSEVQNYIPWRAVWMETQLAHHAKLFLMHQQLLE